MAQRQAAATDAPPPPKDGLAYRPCVGILLLDAEGRAFTGRRIATEAGVLPPQRWQLPQGGIDAGEAPRAAAFRELKEEVGTGAAELLGEYPGWLTYDFPDWVLAHSRSRGYRGQTQRWFAMRFLGRPEEIDLAAHEPPEFDAFLFRPLAELPGLVVPFKRPVYEAVTAHFAPLAEALAHGRLATGARA